MYRKILFFAWNSGVPALGRAPWTLIAHPIARPLCHNLCQCRRTAVRNVLTDLVNTERVVPEICLLKEQHAGTFSYTFS